MIDRHCMTTEDGERIAAGSGCYLGDALLLDRVQDASHEKIVSRCDAGGG